MANPFPDFRQLSFHRRSELSLREVQVGRYWWWNRIDLVLLFLWRLGVVLLYVDDAMLIDGEETSFIDCLAVREQSCSVLQSFFVLTLKYDHTFIGMWDGIRFENVRELGLAEL